MCDDVQTIKCPYCEGEISSDAKKCMHCGEWIQTIPQELDKFNWGAFLLNWIWGIMHKKYITLLYFPSLLIPVIGPLAVSIWFGIKGNEWAWMSKTWSSVDDFNESQQNWVRLWFILMIYGFGISFSTFVFLVFLGLISVASGI